MHPSFLSRVILLALIILSPCKVWAGLLDETCERVYQQLSSGPYDGLIQTTENFTDKSQLYNGCVIRFSGNATKITQAQDPGTLLGTTLPYCPDGKILPDLPPDSLNKEGWCADLMADGPDGTFYRALKENVFCVVEGHWDGGDDSDPTYVPSHRYSVIVKCAGR
jgi:hypothetical protein